MQRAARMLSGVGLAVLLAACSDPGPEETVAPWQPAEGAAANSAGAGAVPVSSDSGATAELELPPTGAAACDQWREALISRIEACGVEDAPVLAESIRSIICVSDVSLPDCVEQLNAGDCGVRTYAGCDIGDITDIEAAQAECDRLVSAHCEFRVGCGYSDSVDRCVSDVTRENLDCSLAWGVGSGLEDCIAGLERLECGAESLPEACQSAVKLSGAEAG